MTINSIIELPYNFKPRKYELAALKAGLIDKKKSILLIWHRRAGKDITALNYVILKMMERVGTYLYLFPELKQARRDVWDAITSEGRKMLSYIPKAMIKRINNSDMSVELFNGSVLLFGGADRYDMLMGGNFSGIVYSEFSLQHPLAYQYLQPVLAENKGWEFFIYTFRGNNHGYRLYLAAKDNPDAFVQVLSVHDTKRDDGTPVVSDEDIDKIRKMGTMTEGLIQQEFFCNPLAFNDDTIFGKQLEAARNADRIYDFPIDNAVPVYCFWDLGRSDATAIWFVQFVREEIRMINYYENNFQEFPFYANIIDEFKKKYNLFIKDHFPPHDAKHVRLGMAGKSLVKMAQEAGIGFCDDDRHSNVVPRTNSEEESHQATRSIFNRCYFHKTNCKLGIDCLSNYTYKYDDERKVYSVKPVHNWASHGAHAFMAIALVIINDMIPNQYAGTISQKGAPRVRL